MRGKKVMKRKRKSGKRIEKKKKNTCSPISSKPAIPSARNIIHNPYNNDNEIQSLNLFSSSSSFVPGARQSAHLSLPLTLEMRLKVSDAE